MRRSLRWRPRSVAKRKQSIRSSLTAAASMFPGSAFAAQRRGKIDGCCFLKNRSVLPNEQDSPRIFVVRDHLRGRPGSRRAQQRAIE
jgi:hypothetical protein